MRKDKTKHYSLIPKKRKKFQLDFWAGYLFFWVIVLYIIAFGYFQTGWFEWTDFNLSYMIIIIPIWSVDGFKVFIESFTRRSYRSSEEDLNTVTVVIACKDGEDVIEATIKSLLKKFKPEQIILASNGSSDNTCYIARGYGVRVLDVKAPLGKVRAINYALKYVKTPNVLLLDDDTLVGEAVIPTGLLDEGYEGVAFRVLVKVSNWVSKIQMYEYRKSTDIGKRYHNNKASVNNISGAIGLFRLKQLQSQIRRHSGEFSGEDLQRTLLIHLAQDSKGVVLTDSTVYTQPPTTMKVLFQQRSFGWFPGLYANFANYMRVMTRDYMPFALRFDAFYNVFLVMLLDIVRLLSLPILIFYPWYFIIMYCIYFIFESISYVKSGSSDPFWIVLIYPFYGLFGFITRACAFATFLYRRLAVKIGKMKFLDDYRPVRPIHKIVSIVLTTALLSSLLALNVWLFYVRAFINISP
ncbi:MAG: Poly-beta,6-N-acetyl-D-glucosamine synthase [Patescibacteria group bacterium]|nr:Poly-beta,6-N-acetyl-D-glucosamine synthase [Patescibacteria group bacterium]